MTINKKKNIKKKTDFSTYILTVKFTYESIPNKIFATINAKINDFISIIHTSS